MSRALLINAIVAAVSQNHKAGITQAAAGTALDAVVNTIKHSLKTTGTFNIYQFGTFRTAARAARTGVNPQTRTPLQISASQSVAFKPSTTLRAEAQSFIVAPKRAAGQRSTVASEPPVPAKKVPKARVTKTSTKKSKQ